MAKGKVNSSGMTMARTAKAGGATKSAGALSSLPLRDALVAHFTDKTARLRLQWVQEVVKNDFTEGLSKDELESETVSIYEIWIDCLATGQFGSAQAYARRMAEQAVMKAVDPEQVFGRLLTLRDVFGRSLFELYGADKARLESALEVYEPVANAILSIVAMAFVEERERVVRQQQEAIRELSTPVLQVREGLLILPIIGLLDSLRARQLTEQLLRSIRVNRARMVVIDVTGVAAVDSKVANHLLQTVDAARLMGAKAIITGLSPEIAQTLVTIGVDLSRLISLSDLQSGIDEADRLLGYRVIASQNPTDLD